MATYYTYGEGSKGEYAHYPYCIYPDWTLKELMNELRPVKHEIFIFEETVEHDTGALLCRKTRNSTRWIPVSKHLMDKHFEAEK